MAFLRKIPDKIIAKLKSISTPSVLVGCGLDVSLSDIEEGRFEALGVRLFNGSLQLPKVSVFPPSSIGRVSNENINGREIIHKDKPKIMKDVCLGDRPIYGDWSNGSFILWQSREVYQRSFIQPHGFSIQITEQGFQESIGNWKLAFKIQPSFLRAEPTFESDLLFALSLLRENTGIFDVFSSDVSLKEISDSRHVSWEIFPPGERDLKSELVRRLVNADDNTKERLLERAGKIESLMPIQYIFGAGLASNYYGALFAEDLVVFENLDYGNATYILYKDWEKISKLSRTEILNGQTEFDRLIHDASWEEQLTQLIKHELRKRRWRH